MFIVEQVLSGRSVDRTPAPPPKLYTEFCIYILGGRAAIAVIFSKASNKLPPTTHPSKKFRNYYPDWKHTTLDIGDVSLKTKA